MQNFLIWRDIWLVDIEPVDEEHKELARLLNRVAECFFCGDGQSEDCAREGLDSDKIYQLLESLGNHTRKHFQNEEDLMRETAYPDFAAHHSEHITLLAEFSDLMGNVRKTGLDCLDLDTLQALKEWLLSHIVDADRKFGAYYNQGHKMGKGIRVKESGLSLVPE